MTLSRTHSSISEINVGVDHILLHQRLRRVAGVGGCQVDVALSDSVDQLNGRHVTIDRNTPDLGPPSSASPTG